MIVMHPLPRVGEIRYTMHSSMLLPPPPLSTTLHPSKASRYTLCHITLQRAHSHLLAGETAAFAFAPHSPFMGHRPLVPANTNPLDGLRVQRGGGHGPACCLLPADGVRRVPPHGAACRRHGCRMRQCHIIHHGGSGACCLPVAQGTRRYAGDCSGMMTKGLTHTNSMATRVANCAAR